MTWHVTRGLDNQLAAFPERLHLTAIVTKCSGIESAPSYKNTAKICILKGTDGFGDASVRHGGDGVHKLVDDRPAQSADHVASEGGGGRGGGGEFV